MSDFVYIDFEFNNTEEKKINLVCCSILHKEITKSIWLHGDINTQALRDILISLQDKTFVSYSVEAEARAFIALNLNPLKFKWLDLYLEYRQITNHSKISYGNHLSKEGVIKFIKSPIEVMEKDNLNYYDALDRIKNMELSGKINRGLASACYRLLKVEIDTKEKKEMRDIIIKSNALKIEVNKKQIIQYCEHDVKYLPELLSKMQELGSVINYGARAEYAVRTAIMVTHGYPVNVEALTRFTNNIPTIMNTCREDINKTLVANKLPEIFFQDKPKRKTLDIPGEWHLKVKEVQEYILANMDTKTWEKTATGQISLSEDALKAQGASRHEFKPTLIDQLTRWKSLEASMRGFKEPTKSTGKTIFNHLGSDGRIRPYFGIYGSQSSRSQQTATSFIFLKSAWIRVLVQPTEDNCIIGCDYSSQEFLLSAVLSKDKVMEKAYNSGDVYLDFAVTTGMIKEAMPQFSTPEYKAFKAKYDSERNVCKSLVLGLSYMMEARGLAAKLTAESKEGKKFYREDAEELRQLFRKTYSTFVNWQETLIKKYTTFRDPITLPCGWKMFGQNPNPRSIGNMPIQGTGATIMRKAVALCQDRGLKVIMTLHDCIYIECHHSKHEEQSAMLKQAMQDAFNFYFPDSTIRVDLKSWGSKLKNKHHIDPRGIKEWSEYYSYVMPEWVDSIPEQEWIAASIKHRQPSNMGWRCWENRTFVKGEGVYLVKGSDGVGHRPEIDLEIVIPLKNLIPHLKI